jgi:hypothetical protein
VSGVAGVVLYLGLSVALRVEALGFFIEALLRKFRRRTTGTDAP